MSTARGGLQEYKKEHGEDHAYQFYAGELALFEQNFETARRHYEACINASEEGIGSVLPVLGMPSPGRDSRTPVSAMRPRRDYYDKSRDYKRVTFLLDFMMISRKRYYSLLEDGIIKGPPRLLYYHAYEPDHSFDESSTGARN